MNDLWYHLSLLFEVIPTIRPFFDKLITFRGIAFGTCKCQIPRIITTVGACRRDNVLNRESNNHSTITAMTLLNCTHVSNVFISKTTTNALNSSFPTMTNGSTYVRMVHSPRAMSLRIYLWVSSTINSSFGFDGFAVFGVVFMAFILEFVMVFLSIRNLVTTAGKRIGSVAFPPFGSYLVAIHHHIFFRGISSCIWICDMALSALNPQFISIACAIPFSVLTCSVDMLITIQLLAISTVRFQTVLATPCFCIIRQWTYSFTLSAYFLYGINNISSLCVFSGAFALTFSLLVFGLMIHISCTLFAIRAKSIFCRFSFREHFEGFNFAAFGTAFCWGSCGIMHVIQTLLSGMDHASDVEASRRVSLLHYTTGGAVIHA